MPAKLIFQAEKIFSNFSLSCRKCGEKHGEDQQNIQRAIEHYSAKWYEYTYPAATNVAGNEGGMEYPGIVFCHMDSKGGSLWGVRP
jgi:hypothetical protein